MKILHTPFPAVIIGFLLSSFNQLQTDSRQVAASLDNKNSVILENSIRSQTGGTTPQQQDPDPNALILVDQQPEPINLEDIKKTIGYPELAMESRVQGTVITRVLIGIDGKYEKHIVISQGHPLLLKAVESEIKNLIFSPAQKEGKAIKYWMNIPFKFSLEN